MDNRWYKYILHTHDFHKYDSLWPVYEEEQIKVYKLIELFLIFYVLVTCNLNLNIIFFIFSKVISDVDNVKLAAINQTVI